MLKERNWKQAPQMWDTPVEYLSGAQSMSVAVIDSIFTCKELVDGIIQGAEETLGSWEFLKTR